MPQTSTKTCTRVIVATTWSCWTFSIEHFQRILQRTTLHWKDRWSWRSCRPP
ncbi:hypothetical protein QTP86_026940 [Hemibagrus guttatus]|nr:hypothetical protein QTP86_026940 [Hemibagrus guttatus]